MSRPFPIYRQLLSDNSCGPRCVLMVADYFEAERGRKLFASEWSRVLEITMENDLVRDEGTPRENLVFGLKSVGLRSPRIRTRGTEGDRSRLFEALMRSHPVIAWCLMTHEGKKAPHYAVLVGMEGEDLLFADSYPHKVGRRDGLRPIPWSEFSATTWSKGKTVWGTDRWAVEVYPAM